MSFDPISALLDVGKMAINRIWPDPIKRAAEQRKLLALAQKGDLAELQAHVDLMLAQIQVNLEEAKHKSLFVAGWRPSVGWVGSAGLAYQFILYPILLWVWSILEIKGLIPEGVTPPPLMDYQQLTVMISGMLGIAGMRSYDKKNKAQTDSL